MRRSWLNQLLNKGFIIWLTRELFCGTRAVPQQSPMALGSQLWLSGDQQILIFHTNHMLGTQILQVQSTESTSKYYRSIVLFYVRRKIIMLHITIVQPSRSRHWFVFRAKEEISRMHKGRKGEEAPAEETLVFHLRPQFNNVTALHQLTKN